MREEKIARSRRQLAKHVWRMRVKSGCTFEEIARAVSALSAAREAHLAAEKFFVAAADFSVTRRIGDLLAASLFGGENM